MGDIKKQTSWQVMQAAFEETWRRHGLDEELADYKEAYRALFCAGWTEGQSAMLHHIEGKMGLKR